MEFMDSRKLVGAKLRDAREGAGLSLQQLADATGYAFSTISNAENGHDKAGRRLIRAIAYATGVNQEWINGKETERLSMESRKIGEQIVRTTGFNDDKADDEKDIALPHVRLVPVISWAKAGESLGADFATVYSEETVTTDAPDPLSFAVTIRGDSMEPIIQSGDIVILLPSQQARNGDTVVARLKNGGVICKLFHLKGRDGNVFTLTSHNPAYPALEHTEDDFWWIYPVDSVNKKLRR